MEAFSILLFCLSIQLIHTVADTIVVNQTIRDGETIVSAQQTFELGFFSPQNAPDNQYLAIWYKRLGTGTIGWVANRETPIKDKSGELRLHPDGVLVLRDSNSNQVIWSSDTNQSARNPVARLLDNGNLIIVDDDSGPENYIWQSFDHPGDTQLPGMKLGRNLERGIVTNYTSWKNESDPSQGPFMVYMDFNGLPQIYQKNGDEIQYRLGSWNGFAFTGRPKVRSNSIYTVEYVSNEIEVYTKGELTNSSVLSRLTLTPEGNMDRFNWINRTQGWFLLSSPAADSCDRYALCGSYGSCDIEQSPPCGCLKGFTPRSPNQWDLADWSDGCQRTIALDCGVKEGFRKYPSVKLPDTRLSWFDRNMSLEQCEVKCRNECNCTAYTTLDIKYDTGCLLWYNDLIDLRMFSEEGQDIYIRMAAAELEKDRRVSKSKKRITVIVIIFATIGFGISLGLCFLIVMKRKLKLSANALGFIGRLATVPQDANVVDLPLFGLSTLLSATNNFSDKNKLGEGGYGPVYKGILEDGTEVAVKRLSESSTQGVEEFKNEVIFISKLQHRNLVKMLGCCIEGEEKILVYEYMPNKGLDLLLFDETERKTLEWSQRFRIITGIARGLLYLHQDSRLRIIHRDLKAANILLDKELNPKISDFGLARSFGGNETETNTKRVVGTYGYMSPEYAGDGIFSVKSDVFSFGVLVLEIVSGKKNRRFFYQSSHSHNLLGHAWILYKEGKTFELADESLSDLQLSFEVLRSIHVALLCVQQSPEDRPDMSMVVMMLSSVDRLPEPRQPGFYTEDKFGPESSSSMQAITSESAITITQMEPR